MKLSQYVPDNTAASINSSLDAIFSALRGVAKFDVITGVTAGASAAFSVAHKLGRKPEWFVAIPESDCRFYWTPADKQVTTELVLVAHATAAAVPYVAVVGSRFE